VRVVRRLRAHRLERLAGRVEVVAEVQELGPGVVRRRLELGGRDLVQAREVRLHALEVARTDGDLDEAPERALHVLAEGRIVPVIEHLGEARLRAVVVARQVEGVAEQEQGVRPRPAVAVVLDDVEEDDRGTRVVAQPVEELAVGEAIDDVARALARPGSNVGALEARGLRPEAVDSLRDATDVVAGVGPCARRSREGAEHQRERAGARHRAPASPPAAMPGLVPARSGGAEARGSPPSEARWGA
jgi:hypothetical protein